MAETKNIEIGGRLHSIATGNVLAGANEIFDDSKNKKQSDINTETYVLVNEVKEKLATLNPEQQGALAVATKANKNEANLGYYVCDTEANVVAKIVADATGYVLDVGGSIKIKMNNTNNVVNVTLNINSTGDRPLYYNGERASATNTWEAGETVEVYFDGTNYYANNVSNGEKFSTGEKVKNVGIDDEPTAGSNNLVKSGGVVSSCKYNLLNSELVEVLNSNYIANGGNILSNTSYKCYKIFNDSDYKSIFGQASTYQTYPKVGFYSGEPSETTYLGGINASSSYTSESFISLIPNNCKYIVICEYSGQQSSCYSYESESLFKDIVEIQNNLRVNINDYNTDILNGVITSDGTFQSNSGYRVYRIKNNNYATIKGIASSLAGFTIVAFYSNSEITSTNLINNIIAPNNISAPGYLYKLIVPDNCEYICICQIVLTGFEIPTCYIQKIDDKFLSFKDEISSIQGDISDIQGDISDIQTTEDAFIIKDTKRTYSAGNAFTLEGYYKDSNAELNTGYDFVSMPLVNVREGELIKLTNWHDYTSQDSSGILWFYDNDGLPYNQTYARITISKLTKLSSGKYAYIVPTGASQLGISINLSIPNGLIEIGTDSYRFTEFAVELINDSIIPNEETGDKSSNYYLKGNSNIIPNINKKLGIISAGQSNIDGRNSYSDLPSGFVNPNDKVHFCNSINGVFSDFQITDGGSGNDWSFDAIVYDLLTKSAYGNQDEIYVMKKSMGGTSIDKYGATNYHWTADYEYLSSPSFSLLRTFESIIRKAEELQGSNFEIKAFLWHQGEGDADNLEAANRYYDNLKNMLAYVRGIVGNPRLHFFCGSISENNHANPYVNIINNAYFLLASQDPYFHLVDMRNAQLEDNWHFNYQWSIYFGQKVYDLMIDAGIITGTKINPSEPV